MNCMSINEVLRGGGQVFNAGVIFGVMCYFVLQVRAEGLSLLL